MGSVTTSKWAQILYSGQAGKDSRSIRLATQFDVSPVHYVLLEVTMAVGHLPPNRWESPWYTSFWRIRQTYSRIGRMSHR